MQRQAEEAGQDKHSQQQSTLIMEQAAQLQVSKGKQNLV